MNDADAARVRITPACNIQQRQDALTDPPVRLKTVGCASFVKKLQHSGAVLVVFDIVGGSLFRIRQDPVPRRAKQKCLIEEVMLFLLRARGEMNFFLSDAVIDEIRRLTQEREP